MNAPIIDDDTLWTLVRVYHGYATEAEMVEQVGYGLELHVAKMREALQAAKVGGYEARVLGLIEKLNLCVSYNVSKKNWAAQDCHYNALSEAPTLREAVENLWPKLILCPDCRHTTTRAVHEFRCKAEHCPVRKAPPTGDSAR